MVKTILKETENGGIERRREERRRKEVKERIRKTEKQTKSAREEGREARNGAYIRKTNG